MVLILISVKYMGFKDKNRLAISPRSEKATHAKKKKALLSKLKLSPASPSGGGFQCLVQSTGDAGHRLVPCTASSVTLER